MKKIFWGLCLLLTPCFNIIDIVPDIFGCLLIRSGLKELSLINDSLAYARQGLKKLMWLEGAKLASLLLLWLFRDETTTLLLTFIFSVLEILFYFPLFQNLFDGLESLGTKHEIRPLMEHCDTAKLLLKIFIAVKCTAATLPEMLCLIDPVLTGDFPPNYLQISAQIKATRILGSLVQYIAVAVFALAIIIYLKKITSSVEADENALTSLKNELNEKIGPKEKRLLAVDKSIWLLYLTAILSIRLYLSYYNPICDFLMFITLYMAAKGFLPKDEHRSWRIKCIVLGTVSAAGFMLRSYGVGFFYPSFTAQWQRFFPVYPMGVLSALCLGIGLFMMVSLLDKISCQVTSKPIRSPNTLRSLAVIIAILSFFDYSFAGIYHFATIFTGNIIRLQYALDAANALIGGLRLVLCAVFVFKYTSLCLNLREEVKIN